MRNIVIRHSSPSVADNAAIVSGSKSVLRIENCSISSETGNGADFLSLFTKTERGCVCIQS